MSQQAKKAYKMNSFLINNYLRSLDRRLKCNQKPYVITYSYYFIGIKYFIMQFIEFDYKSRFILFDLSIFVCAIAKYKVFISFLSSHYWASIS